MKKKIYLLVLSMFALTAFGQFPAPTNFNYSLYYFMIGDGGYCAGNYLIGPAYCSHFSWDAPDTSSISSTLIHYKVHYRSDTSMWNPYFIDTAFITTNTEFSIELAVIGWVWVTAVYSNPDGESDSSNISYNGDLPINIKVTDPNDDFSITYLQKEKSIIIKDYLRVQEIRIYDLSGKCIKSSNCIENKYSVADIKPNIYLIDVTFNNSKKNSRKILIN